MGTRSDIHALIDALPDEELETVRTVLNAVRAEDGFESMGEGDLERLRVSVRRGVVPQNAAPSRDVSRNYRGGDRADRTPTTHLRCRRLDIRDSSTGIRRRFAQSTQRTLMSEESWDPDRRLGCASCVAMMQPADHREGRRPSPPSVNSRLRCSGASLSSARWVRDP